MLKRPLCNARPRRYARRHHDHYRRRRYTKQRHHPSLASPNLEIFVSFLTRPRTKALLLDKIPGPLEQTESPPGTISHCSSHSNSSSASFASFIMARESQRSSSSSSASSIFMRGPFTRSTTSPPSLNRQNSHTARQECSVSPPGGATSLLFKVASASLRTSPRSSPPTSPRQRPTDMQEVQWDVLSRRLSENRHGEWLKQLGCCTRLTWNRRLCQLSRF